MRYAVPILIFLNAEITDEEIMSAVFTIEIVMPPALHSAKILIATAFLSLAALFCGFVEAAADVDYSKVGWWQIAYREVEDLSGCQATAEFDDQTRISIALIQDDNRQAWSVFISNPRWEPWIAKKRRHFLWFVAINPHKVWRGEWSATDDNRQLYVAARSEFIDSLADAKALAILDANRRALTASPLSMKDSEDAIREVVRCFHDHSPKIASPPEARTRPQTPTASSAGTAFFVAPNLLVTGNHVVKECGNNIEVRYPDRRWYGATIEGQDNSNDLALLRTDMENLSVASFRLQSRVGEPVATYGFPYAGLLSSSGNFTMGNVAALTGMNDDSRFIQISAQVQPGNSGGPLLDLSGSVIGVVASRLNAIKMMLEGGDVPQDVNFAIQAPIVLNFLSAKGLIPKSDSSVTHGELPPADVADIARKITVQIYCPTSSSQTSAARTPTLVPASTAMEQKAKDFVLALQAQWSKANSEALTGLDALYEDEVIYFGKLIKRDAVIKDKQGFARKFSEREYRPREPMSVSCTDRVCTVRGIVDFRSVDPIGKLVSEGAATFEYQLMMSETAVKIRLENGEVLTRTRTRTSRLSTDESNAVPLSTHHVSRGATWIMSGSR